MDLLIFLVVALVILALLGWILTLIPMQGNLRSAIMILILLRRLGYL